MNYRGLSTEAKYQLTEWREQAKRGRELRATVWNRYSDLLLKGTAEPEARAFVLNVFKDGPHFLTEQKLNNILARRVGLDPSTLVDMDVKIRRLTAMGLEEVERAWGEIDIEIEKLDLMESSGETMITVEGEETVGGKNGDTVKTKRVPIWRERLNLAERKLEIAGKFIDRQKSFKLDVKIGDGWTMGEIDKRIEELSKRVDPNYEVVK